MEDSDGRRNCRPVIRVIGAGGAQSPASQTWPQSASYRCSVCGGHPGHPHAPCLCPAWVREQAAKDERMVQAREVRERAAQAYSALRPIREARARALDVLG